MRDIEERRLFRSRFQSRYGRGREAGSRPGPCLGQGHRRSVPSKSFSKDRCSAKRKSHGRTHQFYRRGAIRSISERFRSCRDGGPHLDSHPNPQTPWGVDTPISGVAITQGICRQIRQTDRRSSPRLTPRTVPPIRNKGTSDPTSAASRNRSEGGSCFLRASLQAQQCGDCISRGSAEPTLHGQPFFDVE